jgi:hypothetical protein
VVIALCGGEGGGRSDGAEVWCVRSWCEVVLFVCAECGGVGR